MSKSTPASQLRKVVRTYLSAKGWFVWKGGCTGAINVAGDFYSTGQRGAPDLYAIREAEDFESLNGGVLGIELKASKGDVQSKYQKEFQQQFDSHGGRYLLVRSLQDIIDAGF